MPAIKNNADIMQGVNCKLGKNEAAKYMGVSISTLNRWLCDRKLPHYKIGRRVLFDAHKLDNFLSKFEVSNG